MTANGDTALELLLRAGGASGRDELLFMLVNRSVAYVPYDRASVWSLKGRPAILALSGDVAPEPRAAFAARWSAAVTAMKDKYRCGITDETWFADPGLFREIRETTTGLDAVWVGLPEDSLGILFERWGTEKFTPEEADGLVRLAQAHGLLLRRAGGRARTRPRRWLAAALAAAVLALALVRVPLRVVAQCEVAARTPYLIAAPLDGVIEEVLAAPGQRVEAGDDLAVYDSRLMEDELAITRRQVEVVEAELASARARAFSDARYRGETALLEARLEQETARLEALEERYSRRRIVAPVAGMVQMDDTRAWRGRPVATGQAVMWLVDPEDTRVKIWLPQDDRIDFDATRPVSVHLHAFGGAARHATLTYVSSFAQPTPDGGYAFPAEAEWSDGGKPPPLGLRGSAGIYGEETSLGYWLFRRPLAWLRRWLGV